MKFTVIFAILYVVASIKPDSFVSTKVFCITAVFFASPWFQLNAISQVQRSSSTQPHIAKSLLKFAIKSSIFGICITCALSHESPTGSKIKDCAYLSLVCPIVEHASVPGSPHRKKGIDCIESVWCCAAWFANSDYSCYSSISSVFSDLKPSLKSRCSIYYVIMFYKIQCTQRTT